MGGKYVKKVLLAVVFLASLQLIVLEVQADAVLTHPVSDHIDLPAASSSFPKPNVGPRDPASSQAAIDSRSKPPRSHSHSCLSITKRKCKDKPKGLERDECVISTFCHCIYEDPIHAESLQKVYHIMITCVNNCYAPLKLHLRGKTRGAYCLYVCYEKHINKPN